MLMGVPLVYLVAELGICGVLAMWALLFNPWLALFAVGAAICFALIMRQSTAADDQRLRQFFLWIVLRAPYRNRSYWNCVSYSPLEYKKRSC